jgi:hypothetical protein
LFVLVLSLFFFFFWTRRRRRHPAFYGEAVPLNDFLSISLHTIITRFARDDTHHRGAAGAGAGATAAAAVRDASFLKAPRR